MLKKIRDDQIALYFFYILDVLSYLASRCYVFRWLYQR